MKIQFNEAQELVAEAPSFPEPGISKSTALKDAIMQCNLYLETLASKTAEIEALRNFLHESGSHIPAGVSKTIYDMIWIARCEKPL